MKKLCIAVLLGSVIMLLCGIQVGSHGSEKSYFTSDDLQMYRAYQFNLSHVKTWYEEGNWYTRNSGLESKDEYREYRREVVNSMIYSVFAYWYESTFMGRAKCPLLEQTYFYTLSTAERWKYGKKDEELEAMISNSLADPLKCEDYEIPVSWKISTSQEYQNLLAAFNEFINKEKMFSPDGSDSKYVEKKRLYDRE